MRLPCNGRDFSGAIGWGIEKFGKVCRVSFATGFVYVGEVSVAEFGDVIEAILHFFMKLIHVIDEIHSPKRYGIAM